MNHLLRCVLASSFLLAACGDDGSGEEVEVDAAPSADAQATGYVDLITGTWSKGQGSDSYYCSYLNVTEDMYITGFEAIAPLGTHHTVVSVTDAYNGPDQETDCDANTIAEQLLFASGVGTDTYELPDGVALKVTAGQTLMLQLHLYNASGDELSGTSGVKARLARPEDVEHEAEFIFAGTFNIDIPGDGTDHTASGACSMLEDGNLFTLWPHMHQVGKHMTIELGDQMLLDEPYSFQEQKMYSIEPLAVSKGDKITVTCTWNNPQGNAPKKFGDNSEDEMCFGGIYRYPKSGAFPFCVN